MANPQGINQYSKGGMLGKTKASRRKQRSANPQAFDATYKSERGWGKSRKSALKTATIQAQLITARGKKK